MSTIEELGFNIADCWSIQSIIPDTYHNQYQYNLTDNTFTISNSEGTIMELINITNCWEDITVSRRNRKTVTAKEGYYHIESIRTHAAYSFKRTLQELFNLAH